MNGTIVNCNMHANSCPINEVLATVESMSVWIKKARVFRANARHSKQ